MPTTRVAKMRGLGIPLALLAAAALAGACRTTPERTLEPTTAPAPASTSTPGPTPSPTPRPPPASPTASPTPTPTHTPESKWKPGLPEECPAAAGEAPDLSSQAPGRSVAEIFEAQIRNYLNQRGGAVGLEAALARLTMMDGTWQARPQVRTVDLTGNAASEVVVELTFFEPGQYSEGALFVYRCAAGSFAGGAVLLTSGQVLTARDPDGIRAIVDMNRDGLAEIVYSYISIAGTQSHFTRQFRILGWNGEAFVDLIPEDEYGFTAQSDSGDGVVRDHDGDGTLELVITNSVATAYPDLGPQRARTDIWGWNGQVFTLVRWLHTKPVFRIHAIWDGDDAARFGDYEQALAFYQDAVFNEQLIGWSRGRLWPDSYYAGSPTPVPDLDERPRLNAYGRYRIMLLHAAQGNRAEAQVVYDTLRRTFPAGSVGAQYADLAAAFWAEFSTSGDMGLACAKAVDFAAANAASVLSPLGRDFYGIGQREYQPADVCPFGQTP